MENSRISGGVDRRAKMLFLVAVGLLFLFFCYKVSSVVNPLLISLLLAYIFNPVVRLIEKRGFSRTASICMLFAALFLIMVVVFLITMPIAVGQFGHMAYMAFGDPVGIPEKVAAAAVERGTLAVTHESFDDVDGDGQRGENESFDDLNKNGSLDDHIYFVDANGNQAYDTGERLVPFALLMRWQDYRIAMEPFDDKNGNRVRDENEHYFDLNRNGAHDEAYFQDANHNNQLDVGYVDKIMHESRGGLEWLNARLRSMGSEELDVDQVMIDAKAKVQSHLPHMLESGVGFSSWLAGGITSGLSRVAYFLFVCILIPLYTFFMMRHLDEIYETFVRYLPMRYKDRVVDTLQKIHLAMSGFFRGMLVVCSVKAVVYSVALTIIGAPFSIILGILAGMLTVIPFFGAHSMMLLAALLTFLEGGMGPFIAVAALWLVVEVLDGVLLQPLVLGRNVQLHPVFIIVSVSIGASLLGLFGALIAVPSAAIIKIAVKEFVLPSLREFAEPEKSV